jgi:hypothetical protein
MVRLLLFRCYNKLRPTCSDKGIHTPHLPFLYQTLVWPDTPRGNGRIYASTNDNYQAIYSTVAYIDPIPLPGSSVGFLSTHTYHNVIRYNTYGQSEYDGFGYETPPQFPFRPQPIDMTPAQTTTESCADPNNLTNQSATILRESFGIEPKGQGHVYQKSYPDYCDQLPYPRVIEFLCFQSLVWRMVKPH